MNPSSTSLPVPDNNPCVYNGQKRCTDESCASRMDICPEEQLIDQTTVFILLTVGMVVSVLLIVLYCFQKRRQRSTQHRGIDHVTFVPIIGDGDNASLYMPPPAYEEVVGSSLYQVISASQRNASRMSLPEEPRTPPPNYDAALYILAHNHDYTVFPTKVEPKSPVVRRSISTEFGGNSRTSRPTESDYLRTYSTPDPR
uniref:Uncharacterized protein n=1 Tax=Arion vulgaris TaxID=1028688 RepID=A0A0B6YNT2_9EUPU